MKLLIVDADRDQVEMLTGWLKTLEYEVYRAYTGERARQEWEQHRPDLVIIDPTLKDVDGLVLCQEMCARHDALVVVMMDGKEVQDEVRCLEYGADDYLQKPFFPSQFLAHIRAVSRRGRASLIQRPSPVVTVGTLTIDSIHNEAMIDSKTVRLTPTESKLLYLLAVNVDHVCTANQIIEHIWGFTNDGDANLIKAHIRHLRQKIERDPAHPTQIQTVPGVGYALVRHAEKEGQSAARELMHSLRTAYL